MLSTLLRMFQECFPVGEKEQRPAKVNKNAPIAPVCPTVPSSVIFNSALVPIRPGKDTGSGFVPRSQFLDDKLTREVIDHRQNRNRTVLEAMQKNVKTELQNRFEGIQIWCTGSLPGKVDLPSSDLDFTIALPGLENKNAFQKLMHIRQILRFDRSFSMHYSRIYVQRGRIPVLQLVHENTKIGIDITIDNDDAKRNTQILAWYAQIDERFPILCKAVKAWASKVGLIGAHRGRLNSYTLCLMVISYLQVGVSPAILPCLQKLLPEMEGEIKVEDDDYDKRDVKTELEALLGGKMTPKNTSSLGSLFAGFLKYYAEFNFKENWISVRRGAVLKKRWDEKKPMDGMPSRAYYIVVEDPFILNPWNCGGSVNHDLTFKRIHLEFHLSFKRLLRTNSIYGTLPSRAREEIDAEGKEIDCRVRKWRDEFFWRHRATSPCVQEESEQEEEWGVVPDGLGYEITHRPFANNGEPEWHWDLKNTKSPLLEWPEIIYCI